ncbi:MAG TPA: hypothetical protein VG652_05210 [Gaiellaceae bacterium]|nr:hypothetical protein [Gaiellaceae bacterium]
MKRLVGLAIGDLRERDAGARVSPLLVAIPELALALVVASVGFAAAVQWQWTLAVIFALALVALVRATRAAIERGQRRRTADDWLLWGAPARPSSALLSWRAEELQSPRLRSTLARSLARIESETRGRTLPGAVPLNKRALRLHIGLLRVLQARLADRDRPVSVRGILLVDRLLTEPRSPLYSFTADDVLAEALTDALAALDPLPLAATA